MTADRMQKQAFKVSGKQSMRFCFPVSFLVKFRVFELSSCETLSYKLTKSVPLLSLIHKTELAHPNCRQGGVPGFCKLLNHAQG